MSNNKSVGFKVVSSLPASLVKGSFYWVKGASESNLYFAISSTDKLRLDMDPQKMLKTVTSNKQGTMTFKSGDSESITTFNLKDDVEYIVEQAIGSLNKVMVFKGVYATGTFPADAQVGDIILQKDGNEYIYSGSSDSDTDSDGNTGWVKFGDQEGLKDLLKAVGDINVKKGDSENYINVSEGSENEFTITLTNVSTDSTLTVNSDLSTAVETNGSSKLSKVNDVTKLATKVKTKVDNLETNKINGVYTEDSDTVISIGAKESSGTHAGKQKIDLKIAEFNSMDSDSDSDYYDGYLKGASLKTDGLVKGSDISGIINGITGVTATALKDLKDTIDGMSASSDSLSYDGDVEASDTAITVKEGDENKFVTTQQVATLVEQVSDDICNDMNDVVANNLSWDEI